MSVNQHPFISFLFFFLMFGIPIIALIKGYKISRKIVGKYKESLKEQKIVFVQLNNFPKPTRRNNGSLTGEEIQEWAEAWEKDKTKYEAK